ncbi:CaiB/BaiF CoA-transferase family protein [Mesorhizobium sp. YR577]|uniref:CaiB/BaiF CoA transferase family protein n=1 Tax=Mesorhizobium sp. YR577 TaxID=1884373 RepID=UPI0008DF487E|nr:CaiB/BaiF CoA-transferase family protein [Mesorhizobium sp. YR577]SFU22364.1 Crotonobetainyl-CoA:carnitine CoA-transferase CaiB [Mesorhizobium sp. YR577]
MLAQQMALDGINVLDLTRLLPGAFATQILADMGADVLKIEQPDGGDYNRAFPPIAKSESGSFLLLNRNKKSLTLNLKTAEGKEVLRALARDADVLIEGFRPGVMERLGLSYQSLAKENPGLIYCAISGYGQTGPWRLKPGHDMNYLAEAGALQLFGKAGEGPIVPGLSIADVGGGSLMATTGILAALLSRARTGKGQFIDISMHDGAISWLALHAADALFAGIEPKGGERPFIGQAPCYNVYTCSDGGYVALGAIEEHFWHRFCDAFGTPQFRNRQWPEGEEAEVQKAALQERFMMQTRDEWVAELEAVDIPFGPVLGIREALETDHAQARGMLSQVDHPVEGAVPQLGFPIKMSGTPCAIRSAPPRLGEHSEQVLRGLGYDDEGIRDLRKAGAI